ncbi:MAG: ribonuclease HI [Candidatus Sericytochromatia bacterium]|nr:ribonuclease HI [Candidatus Sericytochromatia bacterium]
MPDVEVFTDGACLGNPGPGGWAAIMRAGGHEKVLSGSEVHTTNNRMELMGVIQALQSMTRPVSVQICTDSQYVIKGMTEWIAGWQKRGWMNSQKKPVENQDLWKSLLLASKPHTLTWVWVKGHSGHIENERCDVLARDQAILAQAAR